MPQKHIYFNDEMYFKLKDIPNVSELINKLLFDYFNCEQTKAIKEEEKSAKELEKEANDLLKQMEIKAKKEKEIKEADENLSKKEIKKKQSDKDLLSDLIEGYLNYKLRDEFIDEYMMLIKFGEVHSIKEYCDFKGFKPKLPEDGQETKEASDK